MNPNNPYELTDERLSELLGQCDREIPVPSAPFAERLRTAVLDQTQPQVRSAQPRRPRWWALGRLAIAVGVAAVVLVAFWLRTPATWAQVQEALGSKPWIRLRSKLDDGKSNECWISIPQQKIAFRAGPTARYTDLRKDVQFDYEDLRGTVVRAPYRPIQSPDSWFALFQQLMLGKNPSMDELGHAKVLESRGRKVVENGKEWLDVELTLQEDVADPAFRSVARIEFRIDPATNLPHSTTVALLVPGPNSSPEGQRQFVMEIDYPAEGPADIYALGIPGDAKLEDRVPAADVAVALKALATGRRQFDPYFAIAFEATGSFDKPYDRMPTCLVWRRGNQVRAEICLPFEQVPPYSEKPANVDDLTWWKQQLKHFRCLPSVVCDGKKSYTADWGLPDSQGNQLVTAWKPLSVIRRGESLGEIHISPVRGNFPEFFAYPLVESTDTTTVDLEPTATPETPHCSLLTYRVTRPVTGAYKRTRYSLDRDRGYAATRMRSDELEIPRQQAIEQDLCVEEQYSLRNFQRTPTGFWYPTLVVREIAKEAKQPGAERVFEVNVSTAFLLDFNAAMPDSLFSKTERTTSL